MGSRLLHFFEKNMELLLHSLIINILQKHKIFFHYDISINALRFGPVPLKHSCDFTLGITLHSSQTSLITQPMRIKRNPDNNRHHLLPPTSPHRASTFPGLFSRSLFPFKADKFATGTMLPHHPSDSAALLTNQAESYHESSLFESSCAGIPRCHCET